MSTSNLVKYVSCFIQVILLLGYGPDAPPRKLLLQKFRESSSCDCSSQDKEQTSLHKELANQSVQPMLFSWKPVVFFTLWACMWAFYVLVLCAISVKQYGGLREMFKRYQSEIKHIQLCSLTTSSLVTGISSKPSKCEFTMPTYNKLH